MESIHRHARQKTLATHAEIKHKQAFAYPVNKIPTMTTKAAAQLNIWQQMNEFKNKLKRTLSPLHKTLYQFSEQLLPNMNEMIMQNKQLQERVAILEYRLRQIDSNTDDN